MKMQLWNLIRYYVLSVPSGGDLKVSVLSGGGLCFVAPGSIKQFEVVFVAVQKACQTYDQFL